VGEILIETEAGDILKNRFYNYIGNSIAKGKSLVLAQKAENSFGLLPHRIVVFNDSQGRLDFIQETDGCPRMEAIKKESRCFTDDIPGCPQSDSLAHSLLQNLARPFKIDIPGTEGSEEKRSVTEGLPAGEFDHGVPSGYR